MVFQRHGRPEDAPKTPQVRTRAPSARMEQANVSKLSALPVHMLRQVLGNKGSHLGTPPGTHPGPIFSLWQVMLSKCVRDVVAAKKPDENTIRTYMFDLVFLLMPSDAF